MAVPVFKFFIENSVFLSNGNLFKFEYM